MDKNRNTHFYSEGLQFECTRCGRCCTGAPGFVYLSEQEIVLLSAFLKVDIKTFINTYTRLITVFTQRRISLIERSDYSCIFWNGLCIVYTVRPYQCRSYPFWKRILISRREWQKEGEKCPGIERGRMHSGREIDNLLLNTPVYDVTRFTLIPPDALE